MGTFFPVILPVIINSLKEISGKRVSKQFGKKGSRSLEILNSHMIVIDVNSFQPAEAAVGVIEFLMIGIVIRIFAYSKGKT